MVGGICAQMEVSVGRLIWFYEKKAKRRKSADGMCREDAVQLALRIEGGESALKRADELVATAVDGVGAGSSESDNESSNGSHSDAQRARL